MNPILIGIPFDGGIRMMQRFGRGVPGASDAPGALLAELDTEIPQAMLDMSAFMFEGTNSDIADPEAIKRDNERIKAAHSHILQSVTQLAGNSVPVSIGGDHSVTYPLVKAVSSCYDGRLGVINIDAHPDMRPLESHGGVDGLISSGNPFRRIIEDCNVAVQGEDMLALGIHDSQSPIFSEMENYALAKGVRIIYDHQCNELDFVVNELQSFINQFDGVYLSLDIDAVEDVKGVSAPATVGITREIWLGMIHEVIASGKLIGMDLVEVSSRGTASIDSHTLQLACESLKLVQL